MGCQDIKKLYRVLKGKYVSPYCIACVYAALGELNFAFEWLERACEERSHLLLGLRVDPKLDALRADSRFSDC